MKKVIWMRRREGETPQVKAKSRHREQDWNSTHEATSEEKMESTEKASGAARHLSPDEVRSKMRMTSGFWKIQKWLVVYNALIDPRPASEIAKHTGVSVATVQRILSEYNALGPKSIESKEKTRCRGCHA